VFNKERRSSEPGAASKRTNNDSGLLAEGGPIKRLPLRRVLGGAGHFRVHDDVKRVAEHNEGADCRSRWGVWSGGG
jgi:hypothetical protein